MNFMDAVSNMSAGKKLIRPYWSGYYLSILSGQSYIWTLGNTGGLTINAGIYTPSIEDINATDWVVKP